MTNLSTTYSIDDGHSNAITSGLQGYDRARQIAQRIADERGESVYLYSVSESDEDYEQGDSEEVEATTVRCSCGDWSGVRCDWVGHLDETLLVEHMPDSVRSSHEAAGNRGIYPHNGALRSRVHRDCAAHIVSIDGEWCSIVDTAGALVTQTDAEDHVASLSDALSWAASAADGDYLVEYDDTGMTDTQDPGSRCGYDDIELDQIRRALADREMTLVADDRGLVAQAVRS